MRENQNKMARFTKALLLEKMSGKRQPRRESRRWMMTLVVLKKRFQFLAPVCLLIYPLFQSVESEGIQRHRSCHPRLNLFHKPAHKLARLCSSSSTRQAITYASVCFPPQCIFLLLSNRIFNSDTNPFSTSYARILRIPFTNCPGEGNFFSPRRHNSREDWTKEVGRAREKWVQRHYLRMRHKRNEPRAYHGLIMIMNAFNSMRLLRDA